MASYTRYMEAWLQRELPHVGAEAAAALTHVVDVLVREFAPEQIYLFGSHARGDAQSDSDFDLLIVLPELAEPSYRLAQRAATLLEWRGIATDLVFMSRAHFDERLPALASLPATVVREGKLLYDAATAVSAA